MSTTTLRVGRLHATYRLGLGEAGEVARLDRVLRGLADRGLDRALHETDLPDGEWCVRRVVVHVPVRLRDADRTIESEWAGSILRAMRQMLISGHPDTVHYPTRRHALFEMVTDIAAGRADRVWAWERLGLRNASDPHPESAPADAILAALCRSSRDAVPALIGACRRLGVATVDRVLGAEGWLAVAEIAQGAFATGARPLARTDTERGAASVASVHPLSPSDRATSRARQLADAVVRSSSFLDRARSSRLRPDAVRRAAWAVLAVVEVDPHLLRRLEADRVVGMVAAALRSADQRGGDDDVETGAAVAAPAADPPRFPDGQASSADPQELAAGRADMSDDPAAAPSPRALAVAGGDDEPAAPMLSPAPEHQPEWSARPVAATSWAGLLFLLNVARDIGLADAVLDHPALDARPLRWVLGVLAARLVPLADDDAAGLAFCGLTPTDPPPGRSAPLATVAEETAIEALAFDLVSAVARRMDQEEDDPFAVAVRVAARAGQVVAEPGWIDVLLSLDSVDIDVRRAGLDVDPGWLPWIGCVVRFVYGA